MPRLDHTSTVLNITLNKLIDNSDDKISLILAVILHDIGNKSCKLRKIVESELEERPELKDLAYAYRMEHQYWSIIRAIEILEEIGIINDIIVKVIKLIATHDNWKLGIKEFCCDDAQLLKEADAGWMLTEQGIQRDIDRAKENGLEPMTMDEQLNWNYNLIKHIFKYLEVKEGELLND